MRKDILIHINTGDLVTENAASFNPLEFRWVTNSRGLARYIYCEADIPSSLTDTQVLRDGIVVRIPYTPIYKEVMIRVRRVYASNVCQYVQNPVDGSEWFVLKAGLYGREKRNVFASELLAISEDAFRINFEGGNGVVYNAEVTDLKVGRCDVQNANCLLACVPGNNYRYPISGVGLRRFVNAPNINNTSLPSLLKSEFASDGVQVIDAVYNYQTQMLDMNLNPSD